MRNNLQFLAVIAALFAVIVVPWTAQAQPSRSNMEVSPFPSDTSVEGTVKRINPAARTIEVSTGGHWEKTLELTVATEIRDEGRAATLDDIQEGVKVKASWAKASPLASTSYRRPRPRTSQNRRSGRGCGKQGMKIRRWKNCSGVSAR